MIETKHLILRPWTENDAQAFYELTLDRGFKLYPITDYTQRGADTAREWVREAMRLYAAEGTYLLPVIERATGELIGIAGLRLTKVPNETRYELTYRLRESAWGKGFATEAAHAWIEYGFEKLGLDMIAASITPDNEPSIRLAEKLGMKKSHDEIMKGVPAAIYRLNR